MNLTFNNLLLSLSFHSSPFITNTLYNSFSLNNAHISKFNSHFFYQFHFPYTQTTRIFSSSFQKFTEAPIHISNKYINQTEGSFYSRQDLNIENVLFKQCKNMGFNDDGAAIYVELSNITINKCCFMENSCQSSGGAIRIERSFNTSIIETLFGYNSACYMGGAASFSLLFEQTLEDCNFTSNAANGYGGSICTINCDTPTMIRCLDHDSSSLLNKGSWYFNNGDIEIGASMFIYQTTPSIYGVQYASAGIYTCTFLKVNFIAIFWRTDFLLTVQECIFDRPQVHVISIENNITIADKPVIQECKFDVSIAQQVIDKRIPKLPYKIIKNVPEEKPVIFKREPKSKYAETFVNIQNIPYESTFDNSKEDTFSVPQFFIFFMVSFAFMISIDYYTRKKTTYNSGRGVLGQLENCASFQAESEDKSLQLNNGEKAQLFEPL